MEENTQENAEKTESVGSSGKSDENVIKEEPRVVEKNDSTSENAENVSLNQTEDAEPEDQENQEDFNSARSRSDSECTDSRTGSEEGEEDDDASVVLEREEGDGQESTPNRKVDDDEDKRNPQYIPKKGTFYEHDDRTAADEGEEEVKETPEDDKSDKDAAGKKKVWSEKEANKWSHDRFNDQDQAPKSRQELIAIYGYDIRNEEGPPRARRRRRYGRGPNKYTRNWEDEDAYSKPTNVSAKPVQRKSRTKPGQEEFPPLNPQEEDEEEEHQQRSDSKSSERTESDDVVKNSGSQDGKENREEIREIRERPKIEDKDDVEVHPRRDYRNYGPQNTRKDFRGGRTQRRNDDQMRASVANNVRGITKTRGYFKNGGRGVDQTRVRNQRNQKSNGSDEYSDYILSQNFTNKSISEQQNVQKLEKDMANMTMQQSGNEAPPPASSNSNSYAGSTTTRGGKYGNSGGSRQGSVPPRLQQEQRGSKRYSSLRQRSLPETAGPNFGPYFQPEYPQQATSQAQPQAGLLPHPHPQPSIHSQVTGTTTPQLITVAPSPQPLNQIAHPAANGAPPLMQPQFAQPYAQPPPAFLQPPVAPPGPFIAQQAPPPQILNYAPQPQFTGQFGQFPHQHQHQHQHQQFNPNPGPQPAELYQPQGGITYYSTQNQQVVPRAPPKRVKSAIPIVPPPEHKEPRGRGRWHQPEQESPGGSVPESAADYEQNCEFTADASPPLAAIQQ